MNAFRIFIVEDDPWYGEILDYHLSLNPDNSVTLFRNGYDCLKALSAVPDLITIDYGLPDMTGQELFRKIRERYPDIPVVIISAQEEVSVAVSLLKEGAYDYLLKDENTKDLLWSTVNTARETKVLQRKVEHLEEELGKKYLFSNSIKGDSAVLRKVFALLEKAVRTSINVTITGETGTGKELIAKAIHYNSDRRKKPFVAVNMAAIPKELLESELFGHEKGAFTGAVARKQGRFEEAEKGTLFLDEIAEMDLSMQSKLLRVLQERELIRVGGNERVSLDVRLVVATHKDLAEEVKTGRFREDLYYRIIGFPVHLPPLRERGNDILLLARWFLEEFCKTNSLPSLKLSADAANKLMQYHFPGNVRELKSIIELAAVLADPPEIKSSEISFSPTARTSILSGTERTLKQYTIEIIESYLRRYNHNIIKVAEKLDVGKSTIYKMIKDGEVNNQSE
jgi:two-component system response regulator AtoC